MANQLTSALERYPLFDALIEQRSRRFGHGMLLDGGPLAYRSEKRPQDFPRGEIPGLIALARAHHLNLAYYEQKFRPDA